MMKVYLYLFTFLLCYYFAENAQPYFPSQIVFTPDNGIITYAIDEENQKAYSSLKYGTTEVGIENAYAMKHFPYALPDSPESKYYVQLSVVSEPYGCMYGTYWKYGGNQYSAFPEHWWPNLTTFEIKNYMDFRYQMIHSTNSTADEDYWYSNVTCQLDSGEPYPCEGVYFKKNTDIPLRSTYVVRRGWVVVQLTINYTIISIGKPDEKYFDSIPKNWSITCRDVNLGLLYYPQTSKIDLNKSTKVQIWLSTPPHRINGNDTVTIQWNSRECKDCFTTSPKELSFNIDNFQERQNLTITRVKDGPKTSLIPSFIGGGFDIVSPELYPIYIE